MPPPTPLEKIVTVIRHEVSEDLTHPYSYAIQATYSIGEYPTVLRNFLPYLVGKNEGDEYVVLGFQYIGPGDTQPRKWRCFKVSALRAVEIIDLEYTDDIPDPLKFKKLWKQNCIDDVEEWRRKNYISGA
ncbi:MAG: hypothetical protein L0228_14900 [Planctomycetes bacterium]|nr:hypothetical protein [Planctomycetota bacterium]